MITDINQLDTSKRYTYADYHTWRFQEHVELIKGWLYKMPPAPLRKHQDVSGNLFATIHHFLQEKKCKVYNDAPGWIIEIASPGNSKKEPETKFQLYEENGVKEYWIVFMGDETIVVNDLADGKYQHRKIYSEDLKAPATHAHQEEERSKVYKDKSYRERLEIVFYLNSVAYNFDRNNPPKMDRTFFSVRKHKI